MKSSFEDHPDPEFLLRGFRKLEEVVTEVINRIGLEKTSALLMRFIDTTSVDDKQIEKLRLIQAYVISQSISIFDLDETQFYKSNIREYREARMACYYLLKSYTDCSYHKIAEGFNRDKRHVMYYAQKCADLLSLPRFHKHFHDRYNTLENKTIEFIAKFKGE